MDKQWQEIPNDKGLRVLKDTQTGKLLVGFASLANSCKVNFQTANARAVRAKVEFTMAFGDRFVQADIIPMVKELITKPPVRGRPPTKSSSPSDWKAIEHDSGLPVYKDPEGVEYVALHALIERLDVRNRLATDRLKKAEVDVKFNGIKRYIKLSDVPKATDVLTAPVFVGRPSLHR